MVPCKAFPHEWVPDWNSFGTCSRARRSADKDPTESIHRPLHRIQAQVAGVTLIRDRDDVVFIIPILLFLIIVVVCNQSVTYFGKHTCKGCEGFIFVIIFCALATPRDKRCCLPGHACLGPHGLNLSSGFLHCSPNLEGAGFVHDLALLPFLPQDTLQSPHAVHPPSPVYSET